MTLPASGWFPDPQDRAKLRWWDGRTWGGATRPAPRDLGLENVVAADDVQAAPSFSVVATASDNRAWACGSGVPAANATRWFCVWAWGAIMFASASVLMNPFGLLSLLGVVFGVVGVASTQATGAWRIAARSVSISAIVLAVATGFVTVAPLVSPMLSRLA